MKGKVGTVRGYARFKNKKMHIFATSLCGLSLTYRLQKLTHRLKN
jgi:hypothetical protein